MGCCAVTKNKKGLEITTSQIHSEKDEDCIDINVETPSNKILGCCETESATMKNKGKKKESYDVELFRPGIQLHGSQQKSLAPFYSENAFSVGGNSHYNGINFGNGSSVICFQPIPAKTMHAQRMNLSPMQMNTLNPIKEPDPINILTSEFNAPRTFSPPINMNSKDPGFNLNYSFSTGSGLSNDTLNYNMSGGSAVQRSLNFSSPSDLKKAEIPHQIENFNTIKDFNITTVKSLEAERLVSGKKDIYTSHFEMNDNSNQLFTSRLIENMENTLRIAKQSKEPVSFSNDMPFSDEENIKILQKVANILPDNVVPYYDREKRKFYFTLNEKMVSGPMDRSGINILDGRSDEEMLLFSINFAGNPKDDDQLYNQIDKILPANTKKIINNKGDHKCLSFEIKVSDIKKDPRLFRVVNELGLAGISNEIEEKSKEKSVHNESEKKSEDMDLLIKNIEKLLGEQEIKNNKPPIENKPANNSLVVETKASSSIEKEIEEIEKSIQDWKEQKLAEEERLWNERRKTTPKEVQSIRNLLEEINETKGEEDDEDHQGANKNRSATQNQLNHEYKSDARLRSRTSPVAPHKGSSNSRDSESDKISEVASDVEGRITIEDLYHQPSSNEIHKKIWSDSKKN